MSYKDLPDGEYDVVVNKVVPGTAKTGTKYLNLHLRAVGGEHDGTFCFKKIFLTPRNREYATKDLLTLGYELTDQNFDSTTVDDEKLVGNMVTIRVVNTTWNNRPAQDIWFISEPRLDEAQIKPKQEQRTEDGVDGIPF